MEFLLDTLTKLLAGVPTTLGLALASVALGAVLAGACPAGARRRRRPGCSRAPTFSSSAARRCSCRYSSSITAWASSQPCARSVLWPFLRQPWWCALLALSLNTAAYGAEVIRGGLLAVPRGQAEAGRVCGMSTFGLYRRIILPQALRQAIPAYGNEIIIMVKSTSLASVITIMEITGIAKGIISETFRALPVFVCAAAIYLTLNAIIARGVTAVERRLSPGG